MICHPEQSEGSVIRISIRDSSLRCASFRMTRTRAFITNYLLEVDMG
jgi:hypothetical protein